MPWSKAVEATYVPPKSKKSSEALKAVKEMVVGQMRVCDTPADASKLKRAAKRPGLASVCRSFDGKVNFYLVQPEPPMAPPPPPMAPTNRRKKQ